MTPIEQMYTVEEVAKFLSFSQITIYRAIKEKKIKALKVGKSQYRIKESDLKAFMGDTELSTDNKTC